MAIRGPTMITSYLTSLLDAGKLRVKDCSMMDPFEVVRIIPMPAPLLFEALSTFRIYTSSRPACSMAPRVKSTIKSAKIWSLFAVLGSYLSP